jgi:hypothetical protein
MADFIKEERAAAKFLFGLVLLEFVAVMVMGSGIPLRGFQHLQSNMVTQELGVLTQANIHHITGEIFQHAIINTDLYAASVPAPPPTRNVGDLTVYSKIMWLLRDRVLAVWGLVWIALYRILIWAVWMPALIPMIFAAGADGLMTRKISQWRFQFQSPQRHFLGNRSTKILIAALWILFFVPFPFPPLLIPFWALLMSMSVQVWLAWLPKRL